MSALTPRRAAEIEADPPCITFGEVRRLIAAAKANDDLVAALKIGKRYAETELDIVNDEHDIAEVAADIAIIDAALAKAEAES